MGLPGRLWSHLRILKSSKSDEKVETLLSVKANMLSEHQWDLQPRLPQSNHSVREVAGSSCEVTFHIEYF